ncbi:MAG: glycogen synthase GlgA [Vicinamibacterales bacterium]
MIGSEALPFSKSGGLADVLGALPGALARLNWPVTLVVPRYRGSTIDRPIDRYAVTVGGHTTEVILHEAAIGHGARALLVEASDLYDREGLYGLGSADYPDNPRRFAVLVRAALEHAARSGVRPSIVHAHDWQAGLAPVYLKTLYGSHPLLGGVPSVFTIHNLAYQGLFEPDWLPRLDLSWSQLSIDRLEYWGRISFLKGGINDANIITTVSRTYAEEIQTPDGGAGFDGILRQRRADLVGILNGIDVEQWDPSRDPHLPSAYDIDDLSGKKAAKRALLERYGLPLDKETLARPIVAMISRMVDQKGFDLIAALAEELPHLDATFTVLGTGEPRYQDLWRGLATSYPSRVGARIGFDEGLAHLIEAGSDLFLMPSRFEPCGLNQMYSLRYGTVPVVRAVGGLADTVCDPLASTGIKAAEAGKAGATGFVFHDYTPGALIEALRRALATFRKPRAWKALQRAGMKQDHSWDRSAREYVRIYERVSEPARTRSRQQRPPD